MTYLNQQLYYIYFYYFYGFLFFTKIVNIINGYIIIDLNINTL